MSFQERYTSTSTPNTQQKPSLKENQNTNSRVKRQHMIIEKSHFDTRGIEEVKEWYL